MINKSKIGSLLVKQEVILTLFTILVYITFSLISSNFATRSNFLSLLQQISINGMCVVGMGLVVILGGIDLSVGAVLSLCGAVGGMAILAGHSVVVALLLSVGIGIVCGAFNAVLVTILQLPPIIATLASSYLFRGVSVWITKGSWITALPREFTIYGTGRVLDIPNIFWMFIFILIAASLMMRYTNIGRKIYAVGTNNTAADNAGIKTGRVKFFGYVLCSAVIGFAGLMYVAQMGALNVTNTALTLGNQLLAAALAGGIAIAGGKGVLPGAAIGIFMIGTIKNGLILSKANEFWLDAITGVIILIALVLNVLNSKTRKGGI